MTRVRLKGLNRVRATVSGREVVYWYAWKGGPRLPGSPGSPEFIAAYNEAVADRKAPRNDNLAGLVTLYRSKPEFLGLSDSTQREWLRWLDRISKHDIGSLSLNMLDDSRVRADLMDWRDEYADRPRTADYGMQVLSRVLSYGVQRGLLSANRATGISHLYDADRADLIWDGAAIAAFSAKAPAPVSQALRLACLTGLRRGDLVALRWRQVSDIAIEVATGKSKGRNLATVPLLQDARDLLAEIGRGAPDGFVLLNAHRRPWGADSLSHRIAKFATAAGVERSIHDARGTFATRLRLAGLTEEEIADVLGWQRERVRRILARYVDQERIVRALVRKVAANEAGTNSPKFFPNGPDEAS